MVNQIIYNISIFRNIKLRAVNSLNKNTCVVALVVLGVIVVLYGLLYKKKSKFNFYSDF